MFSLKREQKIVEHGLLLHTTRLEESEILKLRTVFFSSEISDAGVILHQRKLCALR